MIGGPIMFKRIPLWMAGLLPFKELALSGDPLVAWCVRWLSSVSLHPTLSTVGDAHVMFVWHVMSEWHVISEWDVGPMGPLAGTLVQAVYDADAKTRGISEGGTTIMAGSTVLPRVTRAFHPSCLSSPLILTHGVPPLPALGTLRRR